MRLALVFLSGLVLLGCSSEPTGLVPSQWNVINYWAIWCKPCREEIPELNQLNQIENVVPRGRPWCTNSVFPAFIFFRIFFSTLSCFFKILIFIKISNFLLQFPIFGFILLASLYKGNPVDILSKTLKPTSKKQFFILSKRYPR